MSNLIPLTVADLSVPLQVAQYFGFSLHMQTVDDVEFYSVNDWVKGILETKNQATASHALKRLTEDPIHKDETSTGRIQLSRIAADGKLRNSWYLNEELLYVLTMKLRIDSSRKSLLEKFFAKSTKALDTLRKNPGLALDYGEQALYQDRLKRGDTPKAAQNFVALRRKAVHVRVDFAGTINRHIHPRQKWYYGSLTNRVYENIFNRNAKQLQKDLESQDVRSALTPHGLFLTMSAESVIGQEYEDRQNLNYADAETIAEAISKEYGKLAAGVERLTGKDFATGQKLLTD